MNPTEHAELQRQVGELLDNSFIKKSFEPVCGPRTLGTKEEWYMAYVCG